VIHSLPEATYPRGLTHRIAALLLALPILGGLFCLRDRLDRSWIWALASVTLLALFFFWRYEAGAVVQIHPEGLALRSGSVTRTLLWESVREVRYRATGVQVGGIFAHLVGVFWVLIRNCLRRRSGGSDVDERVVSIRCVLRGEADQALLITSGYRGAGEAVAKILEKVNPALLKKSLESVRVSGQVAFGPVVVTSDTISRGTRTVRFAEIATCGLESGRFFVKKQGAWLTTIDLPVSGIPNVFVLLDLLRQLGAPGLRGASLASATSGM